jgi:hypothetical protein
MNSKEHTAFTCTHRQANDLGELVKAVRKLGFDAAAPRSEVPSVEATALGRGGPKRAPDLVIECLISEVINNKR